MARTLTAVGFKFVSIWMVLLLFSLVGGPTPTQAAVMAAVAAPLSWWADRMLPFSLQGVTRWAIDGGLAAITIYLAQFLWPVAQLSFPLALLAGAVVGAIEIPLHFLLAALFGVRSDGGEEDGIR